MDSDLLGASQSPDRTVYGHACVTWLSPASECERHRQTFLALGTNRSKLENKSDQEEEHRALEESEEWLGQGAHSPGGVLMNDSEPEHRARQGLLGCAG